MRILSLLLLTLCCSQVMAQQTVISTGHIPIGIQVKKTDAVKEDPYEPNEPGIKVGELYDISLLCDGFDSEGLPIKLVIPYGAEITIFSPKIKKENANEYGLRNAGGVKVPNNFDYQYLGDSVALFEPRIISKRSRLIFIEHLEKPWIIRPTITPSAPKNLSFQFKIDIPPLRLNDLYLFSEMEEFTKALTQNKRNLPNKSRDYSSWLEKNYIDSLDVNGSPVNPVFPHQETGFFMRISNISEGGNIFLAGAGEYKKIDKESEVILGVAVIGHLKPGNYRLIIEESEKTYGEKSVQLPFTIRSSFWQSGGYWIVILIPLFIVIFFLYRFYARRKIKKIDLLQRLSEAELKAIRAQLNPHFLFNALNAIQNLVNKGDTEIANDYIVKLSKLLRLVLSQSDDAFHSLLSEIEISKLYLELEKMRTPFSFTIHIEENVDENMLIPSMILQPYLENAVVHGVVKNSADKINVSICYHEESCILEIEDNGKNSGEQIKAGKGMNLGKERLDIIKHQYGKGVNTNVQTRFLPEGGYRVSITIPKDL